MLRRRILPAILIVLPATTLLTAQLALEEAQAEECRTRPGSVAPRGAHWFYRVNRLSNQHCWYLSAGAGGTQLRLSTRRVVLYTRRQFGLRGARALSRPLDRQTTSDRMTPVEVAAADSSAGSQTVSSDFASRWLNAPRSTDAREVATISYTDDYSAADTDEQSSLPAPSVQAKRTELQPVAGESTFGSIFLPSALAMAVLLLAGGIFKLSRWPMASYSRQQPPVRAGPANFARHLRVDRAAAGLQGGTQYNSLALPTSTPTDPARDLETSLQELVRDLQRGRAAPYSLQSFAPLARTGRVGSTLKRAKA